MVGVLPIPGLRHKLDDYFFRLKRVTVETMVEQSIRSDGVYQWLLSALERAFGRKTRTSVHDSSTQTKRGERVEECDR